MSDYADDAELTESLHRQAALRAVTAVEESHPDFDGKTCMECANDIPKPRLKMGKIRCVDCQSILERRSSIYRRN